MNIFLKIIFNISALFLIVISLYPGSLIGLLLNNDLGKQPDIISNAFGTTINHFIAYLYLSLLGFFLYSNKKKFYKIFYGLFFLSVILEILQFVVPNRSFQLQDLIANIFAVLVAYFVVKTYLLLNKKSINLMIEKKVLKKNFKLMKN